MTRNRNFLRKILEMKQLLCDRNFVFILQPNMFHTFLLYLMHQHSITTSNTITCDFLYKNKYMKSAHIHQSWNVNLNRIVNLIRDGKSIVNISCSKLSLIPRCTKCPILIHKYELLVSYSLNKKWFRWEMNTYLFSFQYIFQTHFSKIQRNKHFCV